MKSKELKVFIHLSPVIFPEEKVFFLAELEPKLLGFFEEKNFGTTFSNLFSQEKKITVTKKRLFRKNMSLLLEKGEYMLGNDTL